MAEDSRERRKRDRRVKYKWRDGKRGRHRRTVCRICGLNPVIKEGQVCPECEHIYPEKGDE